MNKEELKLKIKLIKKPRKNTSTNLKETEIQNDLKNNLFSRKKNKIIEKSYIKMKKKDIRYQILSITSSLHEYTKKSKKNFLLINELKSFSDYLYSELNKNLQKSQYFNKKTEEVFHDLVVEYQSKGYKIPNLSRSHNLFKKNPLLIENRNDVENYYQDDPSTKGHFINDISDYKEKNWIFLNKVNKQCNHAKSYYNTKRQNSSDKKDNLLFKFNSYHYDLKNIDFFEKKKINKLLDDIKKIKGLIEKEKERNKDILIFCYETKKKVNNFFNLRKNSETINLKNIFKNTLIKWGSKAITRFPGKHLTSKNLKFMTPSKKVPFISFNKKNDINNSKFNLTEVNKSIYNKCFTNKTRHTFKKIPSSEKINKDIKLYIEKYKKKNEKEILEGSNLDLLKKIEQMKIGIKKSDILKIHKKYFSYSKENENRINTLEELDNRIFKLDKKIVRNSIIKSFDD